MNSHPTVVSGPDMPLSRERLRVLVVEDEWKMAQLLRRALEEQRFSVQVACSGDEGLRIAQESAFDVITLDVMLPGIDGFEVVRELRRARVFSPILFLTARDSKTDLVQGLDLGGDDYITKPFSLIELFARLRALTRRKTEVPPQFLTVAELVLDCSTQEVTRAGRRIELSRTEYSLLEVLMRNEGRVLRRQALFDAVWGAGHFVENNTLDAFIRLLRKKIDHNYANALIRTVRGFGYVIQG
jgi:two-component system OmpR family response regulator